MKPIWRPEGEFWVDLFRLVCHLLALLIFLSFLGSFFPIGDSFAVFRVELTLLLAIGGAFAFFAGRTVIPLIAATTVILSVFSMSPFLGREALVPDPDFRLHQHNVLYGNPELDTLIAEIDRIGADVLTLQEISQTNFEPLKDTLLEDLPHFTVCLYNRGGVAVMARDMGAMLANGCAAKGRLAWMRLETDVGPVTFVSIHQLWPWPMGQFSENEILADVIADLPRPVIVAGDFNNVPWSAVARETAQAAGGRLARGHARSFQFRLPWPRVRIDHVIAPIGADVSARLTPGWGSDHLGVTAEIKLERFD